MSSDSDSDEVKVIQPRLYTSKGICKKKNLLKVTPREVQKITARSTDVFLSSVGTAPKNAPKTVSSRWISFYTAFEYHVEFLPMEKSFSALEENDSATDLRLFLSQSYKFLLFELKFLKERLEPIMKMLKIFEADKNQACLMFSFMDNLKNTLLVHTTFPSMSGDEILQTMTETFSSSETKKLEKICNDGLSAASEVYHEYFNDTDPKYPAYQFLKDMHFFHPQNLAVSREACLVFQGFRVGARRRVCYLSFSENF